LDVWDNGFQKQELIKIGNCQVCKFRLHDSEQEERMQEGHLFRIDVTGSFV
jgi:hypothetical protein